MIKAIKVMEIHFELQDFDFHSLHGLPEDIFQLLKHSDISTFLLALHNLSYTTKV
jgi:hypothetical protein